MSLVKHVDYPMYHFKSPITMGNLMDVLTQSQHHCVFIKREDSSYTYANENYIRLMGLQKLEQLRRLTDVELSKNKKDALKYQALDHAILEEQKPLAVSEIISPNYNQPIVKVMQGTLYPVFSDSGHARYVLGIVSPTTHLLTLDFDTIFRLTPQELKSLLVKRRYPIYLNTGLIYLSKMEICTLVTLLKGCHAGEIAQALNIQQSTVESYLINIKNKLAVDNKSALIQMVVREKILQQVII